MLKILQLLLCILSLSLCEYHIDLDQCGKATECFMRESCTKTGTIATNLQRFNRDEIKNRYCDVIIQMRPYLYSKFHVIMQVNASDSTEKIADTGVSLKQGIVQFACTKDGPIVNSKLFDMRKPIFTYEEKLVFCSFIIEAKKDPTGNSMINLLFGPNNAEPTLEFTIGSTSFSIVFPNSNNVFWTVSARNKCDPEQITSPNASIGAYLQDQIKDIYEFPPFKCEAPGSMIITRENSSSTILEKGEQLMCSLALWQYTDNFTETPVSIAKGENFNVSCGVKFCTLCTPFDRLNCVGCFPPVYGNNSETGCLTSECPGNLWMLDDRKLLEGKMECNQDAATENSRNAKWYLNDNSSSIEFAKADCFDKSICMNVSNLARNCYDGFACVMFEYSSDKSELLCSSNEKIWWFSGDAPVTTTAIKCDFKNAKYRDGNSTEIPKGANVFCGDRKKSDDAVADASIDPKMVGGIVGALVLIAIAAGVAVFLVRRRKKTHAAPKTANGSQETKSRANSTDKVDGDHSGKPIAVPAPSQIPLKATPKKDKRGAWLDRPRDLPEIIPPDRMLSDRIKPDAWGGLIKPEFWRYNLDNRKMFLYNLTAFNAYAKIEPDEIAQIGNFNDFLTFFLEACEQKYLDCIVTWEIIWRVIRVLFGQMVDAGLDYGDLKLEDRYKARMVKFAKPILTGLGWKITPGERAADTWMRFFAARVLLWAEDKDVEKELKRQSKLKIDQLESPIRAVVFQYFVTNNYEGGKEMKERHWQKVMDDPQNPEKDKFGTLRQHLLYGLATNRDNGEGQPRENEFDFTKSILDELYKFDDMAKSFTPPDVYWAYLGATECYASIGTAQRNFIRRTPRNLDEIRSEQLAVKLEKKEKKTDVEIAAIRKEWMQASMDTANAVAECCYTEHIYRLMMDSISYYTTYCEDLKDGDSRVIHEEARLLERASNLERHFTKDILKKIVVVKNAIDKEIRGGVDKEFSLALESIEERKITIIEKIKMQDKENM